MTELERDELAGRDPSKSWVAKLISWSVSNQLIVLMLAATLAVTGWMAVQRTPLDAVPDLTDTQVIIRTDFPGQSPQIVEDLVPYPLSTNLLGLPRTKDVRGSSITDSAPLMKIKQALQDLKAETRQMDIRIGVVQQHLLRSRLKSGPALRA